MPMNPLRRLVSRPQRTLAREASVSGLGFITGQPVSMRLEPAPADTGLIFIREDQRPRTVIAVHAHAVTGTQRRTTLGPAHHGVTLTEHILAALSGMRIDNCRIVLDGPEPPGLDGSAHAFVESIQAAGCVLQAAQRPRWTVTQSVILRQDGATLALHPSEEPGLRISYLLDYGANAPIAPQVFTSEITPDTFSHDIARSRTFVLESEASQLLKSGIGRHLTARELLVFGPHGPIDNAMRYADEPSRHKVLDIVGDLALTGVDLVGHVVAYRSGHPLNVELARTITQWLSQVCPTPRAKLAA